MKIINPYITFDGNTEEAFNFYRSVFGGEFATIMRFGDAPESAQLPEDEKSKIVHVALPIGKETVLMGSDVPGSMGSVNQGNNFSISVSTDNKEETDKIFSALSGGGKTTMAPGNTFWGAYFGMCTDKFGIQWMISNQNS